MPEAEAEGAVVPVAAAGAVVLVAAAGAVVLVAGAAAAVVLVGAGAGVSVAVPPHAASIGIATNASAAAQVARDFNFDIFIFPLWKYLFRLAQNEVVKVFARCANAVE